MHISPLLAPAISWYSSPTAGLDHFSAPPSFASCSFLLWWCH